MTLVPVEAQDRRWMCRSCACIGRLHYEYPDWPWTYCSRCGGALTPDEQLVAIARVQLDGTSRIVGVGKTASGGGEILTIPEVAALLRRSVKGTYRLAASGALPGARKVGGRWVVSRSALLRFEAEGRVPPRRSRR